MTDVTVSRSGQSNGAGSSTALFLKIFGGEVMTRFRTKCVFRDKQMVRQIAHGTSAQFPFIGAATASYHTPGTELAGEVIPHAEKVITLDDLLVAHNYIAKIDELKNHYDVRGPYAQEMADALAQQYDANVAQNIILAARAAHPLTSISLPTRNEVNANFRIDGEALAAGIYKGVEVLDTMNAPEEDRYAGVLPAQYYLLAQTTKVINKDWGGSGVYSEGKVLKVAGASIVKTNNVPQTNVNSGPSAYQGDFTDVAAMVWQKKAVGTLQLLDLSTEASWQANKRATLLVAEYAVGHGWLRPDCAFELLVA
jgi:hypothetical protein